MNHLDMSDPAKQVTAKVAMTFAILAMGTVSDAVGKNRLQIVINGATDVRTLIHHNSPELLADASTHKPAFPKVKVETFFRSDHSHSNLKSAGGSL